MSWALKKAEVFLFSRYVVLMCYFHLRSAVRKFRNVLIFLIVAIAPSLAEEASTLSSKEDLSELFRNLSLVKKIDHQLDEKLPFIYNYALIGGYFSMPSAKMADSGMIALGYAKSTPYNIYSLNFQMFKNIELVGNYRVYQGITESGFGHLGFGDDTDRTANVKFGLYKQNFNLPYVPSFSLGFEDFYGSRRFYSFYICATEELLDANLELTLGWGKGRIHGFYGGVAWTPFRTSSFELLNKFSVIAEYDAVDYKNHACEHPKAKKVNFPINVGFSLTLFDFLQIKMSSLRGNTLAGSATLYYNIGKSKGFLPKTLNPSFYTAPVNSEPLGLVRTEKEFAQELSYAFCEQGLNLYTVYLVQGPEGSQHLWLKVINTRYREELQVRDRIQHLLSTLMPQDIADVTVVIEADAVLTQAYFFRTQDLERFREEKIGEHELEVLAPLIEAPPPPKKTGELLYQKKKEIWTMTLRPRLITFFGSTTGKIKYTTGFIAGPEGYLFDEIYYKMQVAYNIKSSLAKLKGLDVYNLSHLPIVRSDSVLYYQGHNFALEQAYLQKGHNLGGGWYTRAALGYFEPAYGGVALEALYYPVNSSWAVGFEAASVLKRKYHGIDFTTKTVQFNKQNIPEYIHFIGYQYFLDIYYEYKPWNVDFKMMVGQFLARDKGARFEIGRYYSSGVRFSIWYTLTNGKDVVNCKRYYDKGIAFSIPFDFFLKKSSRSMLGYAMSAWLRDVGAQSATGKKLYHTIQTERENVGYKLD